LVDLAPHASRSPRGEAADGSPVARLGRPDDGRLYRFRGVCAPAPPSSGSASGRGRPDRRCPGRLDSRGSINQLTGAALPPRSRRAFDGAIGPPGYPQPPPNGSVP